jgi:hypothetical protein
MANKISYDSIITVLQNKGYSRDAADALYNELVIVEKKLAPEKEPTERKPTEYVIVVNDPANIVPTELTGWIIKKVPAIKDKYCFSEHTPEMWGDLEVEDRLYNWGREMASSDKFKPHKYRCMGDYMEFGNKKLAKEYGMQIVTKMPVFICGVNPDLKCMNVDGVEITETVDSLN